MSSTLSSCNNHLMNRNHLISWNMSAFLFFLRDGGRDCKLSHLDMWIKLCWFEDRKEDLSCSDESSLTDEQQSSSDHAALLFPLLWLSVTACWPQRLKLTWPLVTTCVMSPRCHRCTDTSVHSWGSADSRLSNCLSCVLILSNHFPAPPCLSSDRRQSHMTRNHNSSSSSERAAHACHLRWFLWPEGKTDEKHDDDIYLPSSQWVESSTEALRDKWECFIFIFLVMNLSSLLCSWLQSWWEVKDLWKFLHF